MVCPSFSPFSPFLRHRAVLVCGNNAKNLLSLFPPPLSVSLGLDLPSPEREGGREGKKGSSQSALQMEVKQAIFPIPHPHPARRPKTDDSITNLSKANPSSLPESLSPSASSSIHPFRNRKENHAETATEEAAAHFSCNKQGEPAHKKSAFSASYS